MKKKRVVFSILLCAMMILQSFVCTVGLAEDESVSDNGILTIADFGTIDAIKASGMLKGDIIVPSVDEVYDDAVTSLEIKTEKVVSGVLSTGDIDWSKYAYLRMRLYAEKTGDVINLISTTLPTSGLNYNPYMRTTYKVSKTGWHDITIKLSSFSANAKPLQAGGEAHSPEWNEMKAFYMAIGEWGTAYTPGSSVYIDEIWLEKADADHSVDDGLIDKSQDTVLVDFSTMDAISAKSGNPQSTNTRNGGNTIYSVWNPRGNLANDNFNLYNNADAPLNLNIDYYINIWLYSPAPQDGGLHVVFNNGNDHPVLLTKAVDWKGWKLFSIKGPKYSNVSKIYLNTGGWPNWAVPGTYSARFFSPGTVGVEKAWISSAAVTDPNLKTVPETATGYNYAPDVYVANEFISAESAKCKSGWALSNVTASVDNSYKSQITGRFKWDKSDKDSRVSGHFFKAAKSYNQTNAEIQTTKIQPDVIAENDFNYVNILVYNPGPKKISDKISNIAFVIFYGSAINKSWTQDSWDYLTTYSPELNWTGWKVVSIPIDRAKAVNGIYSIRADSVFKYETGWADIGNYIDVDSVWLSKNAYTANSFESASVEDGSDDVSIYNNTLEYSFANTLSENSKEAITVYKNYVPLDSSLYSIEINGKSAVVTIGDKLDESGEYTVKFDKNMTDGYGVKLGTTVTNTFTVEDIHLESEVLTMNSSEISGFKGMTISQFKDSIEYPEGTVITVKKGNAVISDENTLLESGMSVVFTKDDVEKTYKLAYSLSNVDNIRFTLNGEEAPNYFTQGTLAVTADAYCYNKVKSAPVSLILAQYKGNELLKVDFESKNVSVKDSLNATIELESVIDTTIAVFAWDGIEGSMNPIIKALKLDADNYLWMPEVFASNAVFESNTELEIYGEATPGVTVTVEIDGKTYSAVVGADAKWSVIADAISIENAPYTLKVSTSGGGLLEFANISVTEAQD